MKTYCIIVENTHDVFDIGEFESLQAARDSDTEHFSHGENFIVVPKECLTELILRLTAEKWKDHPIEGNQ